MLKGNKRILFEYACTTVMNITTCSNNNNMFTRMLLLKLQNSSCMGSTIFT